MKLWPFNKKTAEDVLDRKMDLPPGVVLALPDEPLPAITHLASSSQPELSPTMETMAQPFTEGSARPAEVPIDPQAFMAPPEDTLPLEQPPIPTQNTMEPPPAQTAIHPPDVFPMAAPAQPHISPELPMEAPAASNLMNFAPPASAIAPPYEPAISVPEAIQPLPMQAVEPTESQIQPVAMPNHESPQIFPMPEASTEVFQPAMMAFSDADPATLDLVDPLPNSVFDLSPAEITPAPILAPEPEFVSDPLFDLMPIPDNAVSSMEHSFEPLQEALIDSSMMEPSTDLLDGISGNPAENHWTQSADEFLAPTADYIPMAAPEPYDFPADSPVQHSMEIVDDSEFYSPIEDVSPLDLQPMTEESSFGIEINGFSPVEPSFGHSEMDHMLTPPASQDDFMYPKGMEEEPTATALTDFMSDSNDAMTASIEAMPPALESLEASYPTMSVLESSEINTNGILSATSFNDMGHFDPLVSEDTPFNNQWEAQPFTEEPNIYPAEPEAENTFLFEDALLDDSLEMLPASLPSTEDTKTEEEPVYFADGLEDLGAGESLDNYDFGHYDDPDEPAMAFVLDEEEPQVQDEHNLDHLLTSLSQSMPDCEPEPDIMHPAAMASSESTWSEPQPPAVTQIQPEPISIVEPSLTSQAPNPMPIPPQEASQSSKPFKRADYSNQKLYTDCWADALSNFEQETLLQDTRFLKDSINNLVERYFAQHDPETSV